METLKIISIILAIVVALIILLVGVFTKVLREESDGTKPYSFSRVQLWVWSLVICPAFSLHWGAHCAYEICEQMINPTSLILLGISGGVTLTAAAVAAAKKNSANKSDVKSVSGTHVSFMADILTGDDKNFSVSRLQQIVFTLIYVVIYLSMFFNEHMKYPDFHEYAYVLMGISAGTYVVSKAQGG